MPAGQNESRKRPRKAFHYPAWILTGPNDQPRKCMLSDVSDTGARVVGIGNGELPKEFFLVFSQDGSARRRCRQVWRTDDRIGVQFLGRPDPSASGPPE